MHPDHYVTWEGQLHAHGSADESAVDDFANFITGLTGEPWPPQPSMFADPPGIGLNQAVGAEGGSRRPSGSGLSGGQVSYAESAGDSQSFAGVSAKTDGSNQSPTAGLNQPETGYAEGADFNPPPTFSLNQAKFGHANTGIGNGSPAVAPKQSDKSYDESGGSQPVEDGQG